MSVFSASNHVYNLCGSHSNACKLLFMFRISFNVLTCDVWKRWLRHLEALSSTPISTPLSHLSLHLTYLYTYISTSLHLSLHLSSTPLLALHLYCVARPHRQWHMCDNPQLQTCDCTLGSTCPHRSASISSKTIIINLFFFSGEQKLGGSYLILVSILEPTTFFWYLIYLCPFCR